MGKCWLLRARSVHGGERKILKNCPRGPIIHTTGAESPGAGALSVSGAESPGAGVLSVGGVESVILPFDMRLCAITPSALFFEAPALKRLR